MWVYDESESERWTAKENMGPIEQGDRGCISKKKHKHDKNMNAEYTFYEHH